MTNRTPGQPRNQTPRSPLNGTIQVDHLPASPTGSYYENVNVQFGGKTYPAELVSVLPNPRGLPVMTMISRDTRNGRHTVTIGPKSASPAAPQLDAATPSVGQPAVRNGGRSNVTVGDAFDMAFFDARLVADPPNEREFSLLKERLNAPHLHWTPWTDIGSEPTLEATAFAIGENFALASIRVQEQEAAAHGQRFTYLEVSDPERAAYREVLGTIAKGNHGFVSGDDSTSLLNIVGHEHDLAQKYGNRLNKIRDLCQLTPAEWKRTTSQARRTYDNPDWEPDRSLDVYLTDTNNQRTDRELEKVDALLGAVTPANRSALISILSKPRGQSDHLPPQVRAALKREFGTLDGVEVSAAEDGRGFLAQRIFRESAPLYGSDLDAQSIEELHRSGRSEFETTTSAELHVTAVDVAGNVVASAGKPEDTGVPYR